MRATVMYGAGDVRVEDDPGPHLIEPTDALVVVSRAAIFCFIAGNGLAATALGFRGLDSV